MTCKVPKEITNCIEAAVESNGMLKEMMLENETGTIPI
jgi:hypothetical protein